MAVRPATSESEGATTDEDVHLSPTSICSGGGSRIKILCSFGGRIMPRRSDGTLKYIGGETRVLAVPRSIPFSDLKKKVEEMFKTEVAAIKYQLLSEDLDVLVSVTCDDDLVHMLDEYDRLEEKRSPSASPRFRVYIFASHPPAVSSAAATVSSSRHTSYAPAPHHPHLHHPHHLHQFQPERYVATMPATPSGSPSYSAHAHGAVSAGNSPRADAVGSDHAVFGLGMQRVRSTPNLGGLDAAPQHFHQHAADGGGGLAGYTSSSPGRAGAGHVVSQGSLHSYYHPHHQYAPAPVHVPHHAGVAGRYDTRVYVRGSNYAAPAAAPPPMMPVAVRSGRPVSRGGGGPPYSDMLTPKKATTIWD
ncbi:TSC22 domain family protein 1-like [Oryza brachyantha]|uniref:TSC22 domain family protein 1-like n=1 Tax=Oryza brachyantha TaxID=4533 RepID=UPI001ADAAC2F|nr:TSC22 domain family protein 1-like [Oryza brachyantha]XP_040380016.1 TSC22 domain family protein 1-like [Oryza brachyantha]